MIQLSSENVIQFNFDNNEIEAVLRRRGHVMKSQGDISKVLFPRDSLNSVMFALGQWEWSRLFGIDPIAPYLKHFAHASFRKLAKHILTPGANDLLIADLPEMTKEKRIEYLEFLETLQVIETTDDRVHLKRVKAKMGSSLEHYVAEFCKRDLYGSTAWGVHLDDLPTAGGDFDVLAWLEPSLVYIECKSGRYRNIKKRQLKEFIERSSALNPDLSIFLIDTDEDLGGSIHQRMLGAMKEHFPQSAEESFGSGSEYAGVYYVHPKIFITNSDPGILLQIRRCLKHYYAHVRDRQTTMLPLDSVV